MKSLKTVTVAGTRALAEFERLRAESNLSGLRPYIIGELDSLELLEEDFAENIDADFDAASVLQASAALKMPDWFQQRLAADPECFAAEDGEWLNDSPPNVGLVTHLDWRTKTTLPEVCIGLVPAEEAWQLFAQLNWGGWNDCPMPHEHCAVHRFWALEYGAEVVSVTSDIVQCTVARPPTDRESAMRLARQQYIYCYDIVDQGVLTISALAAGLLGEKYWYFWWD